MRILLVDDDPVFMKIVSALLQSNVGPVDAAFSGTEGLQLLRQTKFDVLVTDLMMEGLNGIDLIRIALAENLIESHRILVLTGEPKKSAYVVWIQRHGIHVLYKPFTMSAFREAVKIVEFAA